jgi:hypothetical protein
MTMVPSLMEIEPEKHRKNTVALVSKFVVIITLTSTLNKPLLIL